MAPRKTKRNESAESVKVEVEKDGEISSSTPTTGVTQSSTRRVTRSSSAASTASSVASVPEQPPQKKRARKSPKTEEKDEVKAEEEDEEKPEEEGSENKVVSFEKTVIIEHCKQCRCFKQRADKVKNALENDVTGIKVLINPEKPRRGCFEVREEGGEAFITLLDLKRPFKKLKDLDMDDVIANIVDKIK